MPSKKQIDYHISKVSFRGYKSIENVTVELNKGLNILIGKNSSGKSNFLECFNSAFTHLENKLPFISSKIEYSTYDGNKILLDLSRSLVIRTIDEDSYEESEGKIEKILLNEKEIFNSFSKKNNIKSIKYRNQETLLPSYSKGILRKLLGFSTYPRFIEFGMPLHKLKCLQFPGSLVISTRENEFIDIQWNRINSLTFIKHIFFGLEFEYFDSIENVQRISKSSFYKKLIIPLQIKEQLKKYSPIQDIKFNESINIYKDDKMITINNLILEFKIENKWVPWSYLSDGTKRLFYLITEITNKERGLVLVEEPELGIHPHQFHLVMEFLKEQSAEKQIIISTHSPQALNSLNENELENILIAKNDPKKGTQINHLNKPQVKKAQKYMKEVGFLSDYWMHSDLEE